MNINTDTVSLVKEFEGCVLTAYRDPGSKDGKPYTIGYGHTGNMSGPQVSLGQTITQEQASDYLLGDLNVAAIRVAALVTVQLNENQFGALVSFYSNVGETLFKKSSVLTNVNSNNFGRVPGRLALYRLNDGKVMDGLVRRRAAEGALWLKPAANNIVTPVVVTAPEVGSNKPATADHNDKKPMDIGAIGALATLMASMSGDVKTAIGNFTSAFNIPPSYLLIAIGVGFAAFTIYNKIKKEN